mgnify:CR=1 FL=1
MIAVIFELTPAPGRKQDYLDLAAGLSDAVRDFDGFISIERFQSISDPARFVFLDNSFASFPSVVAEGRRALVVQRTGWGKSAVYFLATRLLRDAGAGPTLLVSPLLSLMRDQVAAAELVPDRPSGRAADRRSLVHPQVPVGIRRVLGRRGREPRPVRRPPATTAPPPSTSPRSCSAPDAASTACTGPAAWARPDRSGAHP